VQKNGLEGKERAEGKKESVKEKYLTLLLYFSNNGFFL